MDAEQQGSPHATAARVLLCVAPFVPHAGVDHAGGAFLHRYLLEALRRGWVVRLLAPATPANVAARAAVAPGVEVLLHEDSASAVEKVAHLVLGGVPSPCGRRWLRRLPAEAVDWLVTSDVVDLQWSAGLWNASVLSTLRRGPVVGLAHDVRCEALARAFRRGRGRSRVEAVLALPRARARERRHLNHLSSLSVFKDEDTALLRALGVTVPIRIMPVLLPDPAGYPRPVAAARRVLFAAAFHRPENLEAAAWLLDEVLPLLERDVPDVRVRLAGSSPPPQLVARAGPRVEVTGYLPVMADAYRDVSCVAVPVRRGAGVKFKTVEALRAGYPVVSTPVGAEGVGAAAGREPFAVCDDPVAFAAAVGSALTGAGSAAVTDPRGSELTAPTLDEHFAHLASLVARAEVAAT